jgi:hypothetical protein
MFHFTIRELTLLALIAGMGIAWSCDRWLTIEVAPFHSRFSKLVH